MIKLNLYKNKNSNSTNYGKIYGRVDTPKMLDIDDLAEHMAEHGTVYTIDVVAGVLKGVARCIREKVLDGYSVKLDDLCIFTPSVTSKPAVDVESFEIGTHIKCTRLMCRATGKSSKAELSKDAQLGYTTMAQKIKSGEAVLSSNKKEYLVAGSGGGGTVPSQNP